MREGGARLLEEDLRLASVTLHEDFVALLFVALRLGHVGAGGARTIDFLLQVAAHLGDLRDGNLGSRRRSLRGSNFAWVNATDYETAGH